MATLTVHQLAARLADLRRTVDSHLLRSDQTAYGAAENRLPFQAMQVFEQRMTEYLSPIQHKLIRAEYWALKYGNGHHTVTITLDNT